ncbi:uncharacterized protein LOC111878079 [Lactuca sativa]|uniref:uncharacterized protein LOC111878079 n=1 Tax=Lactuca sativa TaxID=4236 RepID=UPI000CD9EC2E|nr:uncharacterized protein LOC111878079 [Lactuca sativa]
MQLHKHQSSINQSLQFLMQLHKQKRSNQPNDNVDLKDLPKDPADRPKITSYKSNIRDDVRRVVKKNKIYCLYCYMCGDLMNQKGGRYAFVSQVFDTWNKKDAFRTHVGGFDSFHNKEKERCEFLMREKQAINVVLRRQIEAEDHKYKARLRVSIIVREGETRWGSHFNTLISLMKLFADVLVVLDFMKEEGGSLANRQQAFGILTYFKSYEFVFYLNMIYDILRLTEVASMVRGIMEALQSFRNTGFASILPKVSSFYQTHKIDTLDMEELYIGTRNRKTTKTNRFHFEVEIFYTVVDMQLIEYHDRFRETSTQLLEYMGDLSPCV